MTRLFLRLLNAPALIILVALGVAIQTSLFATYPFMYLQPDIVLVAVIWCALRRSFFEGGVLTLIFANMAELHSAAPQGLFLIAYMALFLGVRLASRVIVVSKLSSLVILTLVGSIAWKGITLGVLHLMGLSANQWRHTLVLLFPGAVMAGAISVWLYRGLEKFDWLTYKTARARQMLEDELQLEGEGL